MDKLEVFQAALGVAEPWRVTSAEFNPEAGRLELCLDFARGERFAVPGGRRAGVCGA